MLAFPRLAILGVLLLALAAPSSADGIRTLVLRGRVLDPKGLPLSHARVSLRGAARLEAMTDDRGRWSLILPMSSAQGLRREPFSLDVRAESGGKRVPFSNGGVAFTLDVERLAGEPVRVRVRSNSSLATASVAAVFTQSTATNAWVDADFGGAKTGSGDARSEQVVTLPRADAPATTALAPVATKAKAVAAPDSPVALAPVRAAPEPAKVVDVEAERGRRASVADSLARVRQGRLASEVRRDQEVRAVLQRRSADSLAAVLREEARQLRAATAKARQDSVDQVRLAQRAAERARRDSTAFAVSQERASSGVVMEQRNIVQRPVASGSAGGSSRADLDERPSAPIAATETVSEPSAQPSAPPERSRASNVRRVESFTPAPTPVRSPEGCNCQIRGTVEVQWGGRPQEYGLVVDVVLEGPVSRTAQVELFMGSPREFRFAQLPCGDYRVTPRVRGRLRYQLERGASRIDLSCRGSGELRVVLLPVRR